MTPDLTIIIPAHNEANRLGSVLERYLEVFGTDTEFIIVLDACTDGTEKLVRGFERRFPARIKIHSNTGAPGKGGAVRAGFRQARGELVGYVDADGATSPEEFRRLVSAMDKADVVVASRWIYGAVTNRKPIRRLASWVFVTLRQLIVPLPVRDTQCGAKIIRRNWLEKILPQLHITGMAFDVELLVLLVDAGARIKEEPTRWIERGGSAKLSSLSKLFSTGMGMLKSLFQIRRNRQLNKAIS